MINRRIIKSILTLIDQRKKCRVTREIKQQTYKKRYVTHTCTWLAFFFSTEAILMVVVKSMEYRLVATCNSACVRWNIHIQSTFSYFLTYDFGPWTIGFFNSSILVVVTAEIFCGWPIYREFKTPMTNRASHICKYSFMLVNRLLA